MMIIGTGVGVKCTGELRVTITSHTSHVTRHTSHVISVISSCNGVMQPPVALLWSPLPKLARLLLLLMPPLLPVAVFPNHFKSHSP